jgi:glucose-1-phosphate thymidylyltransferase
MIYYPLSVLMLAGIRDILIITSPEYKSNFKRLLGDGVALGLNIDYAIQHSPDGLAQAFLIGEDFIGNDDVCLVLGDNVFYGQGFSPKLKEAVNICRSGQGATIFGYEVKDPSRFGVVEFDSQNKVISIEEKPKQPKSNYAVTGLYFYDNRVVNIAKNVQLSDRGELEISCINNAYLAMTELKIELLGRGFAWLDTGTHDSLLEASHFVEVLEKRQGFKIACIEEISFNNGWLTADELKAIAKPMLNNSYGQYLMNIAVNGSGKN